MDFATKKPYFEALFWKMRLDCYSPFVTSTFHFCHGADNRTERSHDLISIPGIVVINQETTTACFSIRDEKELLQ